MVKPPLAVFAMCTYLLSRSLWLRKEVVSLLIGGIGTNTGRAACRWVEILNISRVLRFQLMFARIFPPIYIQHNQCPCRCLCVFHVQLTFPPIQHTSRATSVRVDAPSWRGDTSSVVTYHETDIYIANTTKGIWPQHQTQCIRKRHTKQAGQHIIRQLAREQKKRKEKSAQLLTIALSTRDSY